VEAELGAAGAGGAPELAAFEVDADGAPADVDPTPLDEPELLPAAGRVGSVTSM